VGSKTGICPTPGNWDWEPKIFWKSEVSILIPINWFNSCKNTLFTGMALTLHKSQLHYSGVMQWRACSSLMSTPSFALTLRNLRAHCSTVVLCCVTITWQRFFKGSLQVTIVSAFCRMWLLTSDIFGRWCSETVNADNGKTRCFVLCERSRSESVAMLPLPQVWKIHYNVRLRVWPMCLSEYLYQGFPNGYMYP